MTAERPQTAALLGNRRAWVQSVFTTWLLPPQIGRPRHRRLGFPWGREPRIVPVNRPVRLAAQVGNRLLVSPTG